ncbi:MAG: triose-phosphate isomerase [Candidatus Liptonbacteria bacterium]|nr:triose-phosphate isomerase [Candidatus Liptonbacteria bacterium]
MPVNKLIIANWKMNPPTYKEAEQLAEAVIKSSPKKVDVVLCPPFVWLTDMSHESTGKVKFGAQDVFWEEAGAFTGEVSAAMLKSSNVEYVIVGHSERRHNLAETDVMVNKKVLAALKAGLHVILCVGESKEVRRKGIPAAKRFVERQLREDLSGIDHLKLEVQGLKLSITYEPVWAISGGDPTHAADDPKNAVEMIRFIKSQLLAICYLPLAVLYGGSVNAKNAGSFLREPEIGGALVGGASLKPKEFLGILKAAEKCGSMRHK